MCWHGLVDVFSLELNHCIMRPRCVWLRGSSFIIGCYAQVIDHSSIQLLSTQKNDIFPRTAQGKVLHRRTHAIDRKTIPPSRLCKRTDCRCSCGFSNHSSKVSCRFGSRRCSSIERLRNAGVIFSLKKNEGAKIIPFVQHMKTVAKWNPTIEIFKKN